MSGLAPHPVPRTQRAGTYCEDYELDGCAVPGCPESCYLSRGVSCTASTCRCEGEVGSGDAITLCNECGLAIYACSERILGWAHFRAQPHLAVPKKWMREDW